MHVSDDTTQTTTAAPSDLETAHALVKVMIHRIAPNLDREAIDRVESLHDLPDFDSLDFVQLMSLVAELTGVVVPPRDYPLIITIEGFAAYLTSDARAS